MSSAVSSALAAAASHPAPPPVPAVEYVSHGRLLVVGPPASALPVAAELAAALPVTVLLEEPAGEAALPVAIGYVTNISGWFGAFAVCWEGPNGPGRGEFDLVLNLGEQQLFAAYHPPQGYFAPKDEAALARAVDEIREAVGEFEKPKFFLYHEKTCAHSRSKLDGCSQCIDVCSTGAIRHNGNGVHVEPHLCMGCGACASVCPSGAMQYNFPSMSYWGGKLKAMLEAYHAAGGEAACLLLHDPEQGAATVRQAELPADVIPLEVFSVASIGLDWLLGALALGANRVAVLSSQDLAPQYLDALRAQMETGEDILDGLGYDRGHFALVAEDALPLLNGMPRAVVPQQAATFRLFDEKRTTLDFCIEHFARHAPARPDAIALKPGAPFGTLNVAPASCTLCLSCVSACPASALQDGAGAPMLRFIERNCVQCGLCENACPEDAIDLEARLLLTPQAKQARILHQDAPFDCVRCGKPFATARMIGSMLHKLSGHAMFATPEAKRRLQMCGDCRVKDMMEKDPGALAKA